MLYQKPNEICPLCLDAVSGIFIQDYEKENNKFSLWQCSSCGGQFWLPFKNPGAQWYVHGDSYNVKDINRPRQIHSYHKFFLKLHSQELKGCRILDLGCGTGEFLAELNKYGVEAYGTDIDQESVKIARDYHGLTNVSSLAIEDFFKTASVGQLDYVTVFEVFEHVDNVSAILENSKKMLKPGGKLIISAPTRERPFVNAAGWDYPYHHLSRWDEKSIRYLIKKHNYGEIRIDYINKFYQLYELFLEIIAKKLKFSKAAGMKQVANETNFSGEQKPGIKKIIIKIIYKTGRFIGVMALPYALAVLFYPVSLLFHPRSGIMYIEARSE